MEMRERCVGKARVAGRTFPGRGQVLVLFENTGAEIGGAGGSAFTTTGTREKDGDEV